MIQLPGKPWIRLEGAVEIRSHCEISKGEGGGPSGALLPSKFQ